MRNIGSKGLAKVSSAVLLALSFSGCVFDDANTEPVAIEIELENSNGIDNIVFTEASILENVSDDSPASLSVSEVNLVAGYGELTEADGTWTYTPAINDLGEIRFSYSVSDGEYTDTSSLVTEIENDSRTAVFPNEGVTIHSTLDLATHDNTQVTLHLGDDEYVLTPSTVNGSFAFINLPIASTYILEITDLDNVYTTYYTAGRIENTELPATTDLAISTLTQETATSVSIVNVSSGQMVSGLEPYVRVNDFVNEDGDLTNLPEVKVYLTEAETNYSVNLNTMGAATNVYLDSLTNSAGVEYQMVTSDFAFPVISQLSSGETDTVYLQKQSNEAFSVTISVKNEQNEDYDAGPLLAYFNRTSGEMEYWEKVPETVNQYQHDLTAEAISQSRVLAPIDNNDDGIIDFVAATSMGSGFPMLNKFTISDFDDNNSVALEQNIMVSDYDSPIQVNRISSDDSFRAKGVAEVTFAFNRAIESPSRLQLVTKSLTQVQLLTDLNNPADIYQVDKTTQVTTDQGDANLSLSYNNTYIYTNKDGQDVAINLAVNGTEQTVSPYAIEYSSTESVTNLSSSSYKLEANNTLLTVTLNAAAVESLVGYEFDFTVDAPFDDYASASFSFELQAQSGEAATLDTFVVDNFNFKDAETLDVTVADSEEFLTAMAPLEDMFFELDVGYNAGATADRAQLKYLTYNTNGLDAISSLNTDSGVDSGNNTIYLISQAAITGNVEVVSQTEIFNNSGTEASNKVDFTEENYILTLNPDAAEANAIIAKTLYVAKHASNYGVDSKGVLDVYGVKLVSGANLEQTGVYYIYQLPVTLQGSGTIQQVELQFDAIVNGTSVQGTKTYSVK